MTPRLDFSTVTVELTRDAPAPEPDSPNGFVCAKGATGGAWPKYTLVYECDFAGRVTDVVGVVQGDVHLIEGPRKES